MEIMVARHAGFCFGVERAIDIVKDAAKEYSRVVTYVCGYKKPRHRKERS